MFFCCASETQRFARLKNVVNGQDAFFYNTFVHRWDPILSSWSSVYFLFICVCVRVRNAVPVWERILPTAITDGLVHQCRHDLSSVLSLVSVSSYLQLLSSYSLLCIKCTHHFNMASECWGDEKKFSWLKSWNPFTVVSYLCWQYLWNE